ncbi:hypothetical protein QA640_39420 [Bradyrhizobium sp. CB82]|uniref:hypothetical protein n=1 Tax=Bradyrhizobium sp. CB82 TaxID=3039159 RepID=UPI0024B0528D|nr:hypothetical protein [Bradyrhizobium sp. CB82]WFU40206.1 hypothetical protein QA640_39420 [Bradyrhizobium sp. CB82]
MNAYYSPSFKEVHLDPQPGDLKPVGVYMAGWLGRKMYTIGLASYEAHQGMFGKQTTVAPSVPLGNLEARLHSIEQPYLFLNLRAADADPGHPLHKPQSIRIMIPDNHNVSDVTRIFDGILYIDRLTPITIAP